MKYMDQAKWMLNGFWKKFAEKESEKIWDVAHKFMELDPKKKEGCELDEFWSHKFLESLGETLTAIALRDKLRKIDLDMNGKMALLEYFAFKYSVTVFDICDAPQGDNSKELAIAQEKLTSAQNALDDVTRKLAEVSKATMETIAKEKALEEQKQQLKKAEEELKAAVDDLKAQEDAYKAKIAELEKKIIRCFFESSSTFKSSCRTRTNKTRRPNAFEKSKDHSRSSSS